MSSHDFRHSPSNNYLFLLLINNHPVFYFSTLMNPGLQTLRTNPNFIKGVDNNCSEEEEYFSGSNSMYFWTLITSVWLPPNFQKGVVKHSMELDKFYFYAPTILDFIIIKMTMFSLLAHVLYQKHNKPYSTTCINEK